MATAAPEGGVKATALGLTRHRWSGPALALLLLVGAALAWWVAPSDPIGGVGWDQLKTFIPVGVAFGGVYAVSGVGIVVLYRATGVLNIAFGAIGAAGALIAWWFTANPGFPSNDGVPSAVSYLMWIVCVGVIVLAWGIGLRLLRRRIGNPGVALFVVVLAGLLIVWGIVGSLGEVPIPNWLAYIMAVLFGGMLTLLYGVVFGPAFAARDSLVKMMGTLGLALIMLGLMGWMAPPIAANPRILRLPSSDWQYTIEGATVTWTQIIALIFALGLTIGMTWFLRYTRLGTAMRALANDREISATLGVPVRQVEAAAWFGSGLVCGAAGLLLADQLGAVQYDALTFTFVIGGIAAALIGGLRSLWLTLFGGILIGLVQSLLTPYFSWPDANQNLSKYRALTPFVLAIIALLWSGRRRVVTISRTTR